MVLRAAERLHAFAVLRGFLIDVLRDGRTADEGYAGDSRMREQCVDGVLGPMDHVEDARRDAGVVRQLNHQRRRKRYLFARFENERVAGRDRVGPEPAGYHRREVERRHRRKHAQRLADIFAVDAGGDVLQRLAHHERGNPAGVLDVLDAAAHGPARLIERLAVLAGDRGGDLLEVLLHQVLQLEEVARAHHWWDFAPLEERGLRRRDGFVDCARARERHAAEHLARRGIRQIEVFGGAGCDPLTTDVIAKGFHPLSLGAAKGLSTHELSLLGRTFQRHRRAPATGDDLGDLIEIADPHEFLVLDGFVAVALAREFA